MSGYTKGPWVSIIDDTGGPTSGWPSSIRSKEVEERVVVRTGGQWPYEWDAHTSQAEAVANARLIAAAPELFEALIELMRFADHGKRFDDSLLSDEGRSLFAARAAIARATGETK